MGRAVPFTIAVTDDFGDAPMFCAEPALGEALGRVIEERCRQRSDGHTAATDDQHGEEQLAALSAALICPREVGEVEVAFASDMGLVTAMVDELLMENGPRRVAYRQMGPWTERPDEIGNRIEDLTRGLAVGLAELERLLRLREARAP
jgi:hypothetical protein